MRSGTTNGPLAGEVVAVWCLFALDALATLVTYWRLPPDMLYNVDDAGDLAGGLGRTLVLLNYPLALGAIALVFARHEMTWALALTIAAIAGSFLVSYTRARAEALGLRGDVGLGSRAERVVVITAGLVLAPWGVLPWAIVLLTATAWLTVVQRVLAVRSQIRQR